MTPEQRRLRASIAAHARHKPDDPQTQARREYRALTLEEYVRKAVAEAPPLTDDQRTRIAALLRPPASTKSDGGAAA